MHLKALNVIFAFLCVHTLGALAAPVPNYPPPHITQYGGFQHEMIQNYPPHLVQHEYNMDFHHQQLQAHHESDGSMAHPPPFPESHGYSAHGREGVTFHSPHLVNDQHGQPHQALVTAMHDPHGLRHQDVQHRVDHLRNTNQYLGHGFDAHSNTHYVLQKHMEGPLPGHNHEEFHPHNDAASVHSHSQSGMLHGEGTGHLSGAEVTRSAATAAAPAQGWAARLKKLF